MGVIIFLLYTYFTLVYSQSSETLIVKDLMLNYGTVSVLTAFMCNTRDSFWLMKTTSKNGFMTSVHKMETPLPDPRPPNHVVFYLNYECENSSLILSEANNHRFFRAPYRWIITNINQTASELNDTFSQIDILVDSEVIIVYKTTDGYLIYKIFKHTQNSSVVTEKVGHWNQNDGLTDTETVKISSVRRRNLLGLELKTCLVLTNNDTINHLTDRKKQHIDTIAKVNYVLVQHLSNIVNATLTYSIESTWGYKNGTYYSGMIGELQKNKANIGGTPLFMTTDRLPVIEYIAMTTPTRSKFVFRQPKLSYVTNVFILPFHWSVWAASISLVLITCLSLFVVVKWDWRKKSSSLTEDDANELHDSLLDVLILALGAVCQQGSSSVPSSFSGRVITVLLFISTMFLYTSYSGTIVALLQSSTSSIQTLNDLLHSRLGFGVDDTVFNRFYFPASTEPVRKAIYLQKIAPPGQPPKYMPLAEGVAKMKEGLFAFHMETGVGYKIVEQTFHEEEKCGLQEIPYLQVPDPWLAIQKNSSYKEMLKIGLMKIQESGLQEREVYLLYTKKPKCYNRGSSFVTVGLIDCYPAAAVLATGICISLITYALEVISSSKITKRQQEIQFCN